MESKSPKENERKGLNLTSEMSSISNTTDVFAPRLNLCLDEVSGQVRVLPIKMSDSNIKELCYKSTKVFLWVKIKSQLGGLKIAKFENSI